MRRAPQAIGAKAHAALARSGGELNALPGFTGSSFRLADGEPIWIGCAPVAMHPRAVVLDQPLRPDDQLWIRSSVPWRLATLALDRAGRRALGEGCVALASKVRHLGAPRGFAVLIAGERPTFPYDRAMPHVVAFAAALDGDDAAATYDAAWPLLGLGPGLTPSGDDFVGAAVYARRLVDSSSAWTALAERLAQAAAIRTHAIGAAMFRDLVEGQSFASLHQLAAVLAAGGDPLATAREVVSIGHASGWDMLAGFIIGAAGGAGLATALRSADEHIGACGA